MNSYPVTSISRQNEARGWYAVSHVRPVWRLEQGRAVLVAYQIYRGPNSQYGQIPGVLGRSEFGLEIVAELAYLVYIMGLSFDMPRLMSGEVAVL